MIQHRPPSDRSSGFQHSGKTAEFTSASVTLPDDLDEGDGVVNPPHQPAAGRAYWVGWFTHDSEEVMNMGNEICPECDGNTMVVPDGVEEPIDCTECGGDGWVVTDDDEDE